MKRVKSIFIFLISILMVCSMFTLFGCSKSFNVNIKELEYGQIILNKGIANEGEKINMLIVPFDGYELVEGSISLSNENVKITKEDKYLYSFLMPAGDITVDAKFEENKPKEIFTSVQNGVIVPTKSQALQNEIVYFSVRANVGYYFEEQSLKINNGEIDFEKITENLYSFKMPNQDVRILANFIETTEEDRYTISVDSILNGSISLSNNRAKVGEKVFMTVSAQNGYTLNSLVINDSTENLTKINNNTYSFIMPNKNVLVKASFVKLAYEIKIAPYEHGEVKIKVNDSYFEVASVGEVVTIEVIPAEGYKMLENSLRLDGVAINGNTFEMPPKNITISVEFVLA